MHADPQQLPKTAVLTGQAITLANHGLTVRVVAGSVGTASALKTNYGGLTKGLTGITASPILAAQRNGVAEALRAEVADNQRTLLKRAEWALPDMFPKAYRWIAEMDAVADFICDERGEHGLWQGLARLYKGLSLDSQSEGSELGELRRFVQTRYKDFSSRNARKLVMP